MLVKRSSLSGARNSIDLSLSLPTQIIYDAIAASDGFYGSPVDAAVRSLMNVPFTIPADPELEKAFVAEAAQLDLVRPLESLFLVPQPMATISGATCYTRAKCCVCSPNGAGPAEGPPFGRRHAGLHI